MWCIYLMSLWRIFMPKRDDIKSVLILGAGPIVIGQACEFDYSGTQACVALKELGYRIILVNSIYAPIGSPFICLNIIYRNSLYFWLIIQLTKWLRPKAPITINGTAMLSDLTAWTWSRDRTDGSGAKTNQRSIKMCSLFSFCLKTTIKPYNNTTMSLSSNIPW